MKRINVLLIALLTVTGLIISIILINKKPASQQADNHFIIINDGEVSDAEQTTDESDLSESNIADSDSSESDGDDTNTGGLQIVDGVQLESEDGEGIAEIGG